MLLVATSVPVVAVRTTVVLVRQVRLRIQALI